MADELLVAFEAMVAEEGMTPLSEQWKANTRDMLTNNAPVSREQQAVTVACMRKISRTTKELAETKARNLELETAAKALHDMTTVDEAERNERRDLKARTWDFLLW